MGWCVKKLLLMLVTFFVFSQVVLGLEVDINSVQNEIYLNESAQFEFNVYNNKSMMGDYRFRIQPTFPDWSVFSDPLYIHNSGFNLDPQSNINFSVEINPLRQLDSKRYLLRYSFRDRNTNEVIETDYLSVRIRSRDIDDLNYPLILRSDLDVSNFNIEPKEGLNFKLILENKNPKEVGNLTISVKSNRSLFDYEEKIYLHSRLSDTPRDDFLKVYEFSHTFDRFQEPIDDTVFIEVTDEDGNVVYEDNFIYNILSYENKTVKENESSEFLKYHYNFSIINNGNSPQNFTVRKPVDWFSRVFADSRGHSFVFEGEQTFMLWECSLEPGQSCSSNMTVSFWPLVYLILLLGVLFFIFLIFESPLDIEKRVISKTIKDDGSIILKFNIYLKNTEKKEVKEVVVYDTLPVMVSYQNTEIFGALMPDEVIRKGRKGSLLKWNLGEMEPLEERILAYEVKLKMNVVGKVILPGGIVKYRGVFDKLYEITSNKVEVVLE